MSTHTPHKHGEETEKLQPENTATEAPQTTRHSAVTSPSPTQIKRWRRYLADEESEARIYRYLARRAADPAAGCRGGEASPAALA